MNLEFAELDDMDVGSIRRLEQAIGDVCLIAVKMADELFAIEAKAGPNDWVPVHRFYPEIEGLRSYLADEDQARASKAALKGLLQTNAAFRPRKRPLRIRRIA